ncbi:MAG: aminomethyltransferase family protein, partial [Ilumatobacteraceae bacterium]
MIRRTPFHERLAPLNATGLFSHWSGHLVSVKYQLDEKAEYFAVRNSAGLIDTSPLYTYRITGPDAERFLAGVLTRDVRTCVDGQAQYTIWCDDDGHVVEDGVVFRHSAEHFWLTSAEPNLNWFLTLSPGYRVTIEDISDASGALAVQGPRSRAILASLAPEIAELGFFRHTTVTIGGAAVVVSRTGYTGDLGYEVWVDAADAPQVFDAIWEAGRSHLLTPVGQQALLMLRIEAGLLLIDADFHSSRFTFTDTDRLSPLEHGIRWMLKDLDGDSRLVGRDSIRREL